ncbi:unnamed protein product [Lampetra fluviatilis]
MSPGERWVPTPDRNRAAPRSGPLAEADGAAERGGVWMGAGDAVDRGSDCAPRLPHPPLVHPPPPGARLPCARARATFPHRARARPSHARLAESGQGVRNEARRPAKPRKRSHNSGSDDTGTRAAAQRAPPRAPVSLSSRAPRGRAVPASPGRGVRARVTLSRAVRVGAPITAETEEVEEALGVLTEPPWERDGLVTSRLGLAIRASSHETLSLGERGGGLRRGAEGGAASPRVAPRAESDRAGRNQRSGAPVIRTPAPPAPAAQRAPPSTTAHWPGAPLMDALPHRAPLSYDWSPPQAPVSCPSWGPNDTECKTGWSGVTRAHLGEELNRNSQLRARLARTEEELAGLRHENARLRASAAHARSLEQQLSRLLSERGAAALGKRCAAWSPDSARRGLKTPLCGRGAAAAGVPSHRTHPVTPATPGLAWPRVLQILGLKDPDTIDAGGEGVSAGHAHIDGETRRRRPVRPTRRSVMPLPPPPLRLAVDTRE